MTLPILLAEPPHARATLRVGVARAEAGRPFLAAVEVATDPHWHVYWRNPGDSGVPTTIEWRAPKGWHVEPLAFPTPHRFAPGGVAAYGYEGRTLFLARVVPSTASGVLAARAKWLVCSNACIPGEQTVRTRVLVGRSSRPSGESARLKRAEARLPRPAVGWTVSAARKNGITLEVRPRGRSASGAEFFPLVSGLVEQSKPATATLLRGRYVFQMEPSPFPEPRSRLEGLIVLSDGTARIVSAPLQRGNAK